MTRLALVVLIVLISASTVSADCTVYRRTASNVVDLTHPRGERYVHASCDDANDILVSCADEPTICAETSDSAGPRGTLRSGQCDTIPYDCKVVNDNTSSLATCVFNRFTQATSSAPLQSFALYFLRTRLLRDSNTANAFCRRAYSVESSNTPLGELPELLKVGTTATCIAVP